MFIGIVVASPAETGTIPSKLALVGRPVKAWATPLLAKAHLIADDHPLLEERELGAERLVAVERRRHQGQVERVGVDLPAMSCGR